MLSRCLDAADLLASQGIDARVIDVHTIKPLDSEVLIAAARETWAIVTAEEHTIAGGLGGAVAETLSGAFPVPIERVGLRDTFATSGPYDSLLEHLGLTAQAVMEAALRAVEAKKFGTAAARGRVGTSKPTDRDA